MQIDLDPRGRKVVIFGDVSGARQLVRRFVAAGATVTLVTDRPLPAHDDRLSAVRYAHRPAADDTASLLRLIGPAWLVVDSDLTGAQRERVADLAGHLHILRVVEPPAPAYGQVTLVGGGPGRTGLLTLDAIEALRSADVIFYDRLAPTDDLGEIAPGAELLDVGKSPYYHPVGQRSIEDLMIIRARLGQSVVRLKGGDPFVFGRGGEEVQACTAAGIPIRVIPGVSSAISAPGVAGIPVTHRGLSRAFTVISGHVPLAAHELQAAATLSATLVILMGMTSLQQTTAGLIRAGMAPDTPAAVIEQAYTTQERTLFSRLDRLAADVRRAEIGSPSVVIIGDVVSVAPDFGSQLSGEIAGVRHRPDSRIRAS